MGSSAARDPRRPTAWEYLALLLVLIILLVWGFSSCSPCRCIPSQTQTTTETETEHNENTAWRDSLIYVPLPLEAGKTITEVGDTARQETSLAAAAAWVDGRGLIHLELHNKAGALSALVKIPTRTIYTSVTSKKADIIKISVPVEKPLSRWKSFKIGSFWYLCGAVMLLLAWTFRKSLLKLIGK